jgi:bacillithiol synthase
MNGETIVPLGDWVSLHPAALAHTGGPGQSPADGAQRPRPAALAAALAAANESWGNPVENELKRWRAGADVVITGQQPGLLGGPLLTLIKACAVAAEVARRRAAGRDAVGFLWLATADDDLPEMGWARLAVGEEVLEAREEAWRRGGGTAAATRLGSTCGALLERLGDQGGSPHAREAAAFAAACYAPGITLGEATARFLARLLRGTGVVIVDALEGELARAARDVVARVLRRLPEANAVLAAGELAMRERGWPPPLALAPQRLPVFRLHDGSRQRLTAAAGACPDAVLGEIEAAPERFAPNVWLRSLVQDAALGSGTVLLGGGELAYHLQAAALWELAGLPRPEWRLRPHVTVVTAAERRLARQLRIEPHHLLHAALPRHLLGSTRVRRGVERLRRAVAAPLAALDGAAAAELPALKGDLDATRNKLEGSLAWLEQRAAAAAARAVEVDAGRWRRLSAFLRPHGKPQERELSVLAPVLRLGLDWPAQLAAAIDPAHPGMHLLHWDEGGAW